MTVRRMLLPAGVGTGLLAAVLLTHPQVTGPGLCPVALFTGHACPGCGMTRAAAALFHGDVGLMWTLHPMAPVLIVLGTVALAWWAAWRAGVTSARPGSRSASVLAVTTVALVGVWAVRLASGTLPAVSG
jgi:hypothetical protein